MATPIISFRGVTKRFGNHDVLDHFELDVGDREKLALIGRSGSGKSTLLRILMTLEDIQGGEVEIDGELLWRSINGGSVCARSRRMG